MNIRRPELRWVSGFPSVLSFLKGDLRLWILPDATDTNVGDMSGSATASAIEKLTNVTAFPESTFVLFKGPAFCVNF